MQFCKDGPDIPDNLLWDRDDRKVVFVCGAGVSVGKAKLPDFSKLADQVMDELLVIENNESRKILNYIRTSEHPELLSVDQVFGQLQQDYSDDDIIAAVSKQLYAPSSTDISYHEIICDLAKTKEKEIRLITTNFDDLFSRAIKSLDIKNCEDMIYPEFPKVGYNKHLSGLVYLHGRFDFYDGMNEEIILLPSSYGKAYLIKKKITRFLIEVFKKYTVVFVGYSAEDPPIRYLMEGLANSKIKIKNAYAFQKADHQDAIKRWKRKGVTPITYKEYDDLWETLRHWRVRAIDFDKWLNQVLKMAQTGPLKLDDWQRSQVVHLMSHKNGASKIASGEKTIPAQWLYCFDPKFRYAKPFSTRDSTGNSSILNPYSMLGFPEDGISERDIQSDSFHYTSIPENAKDIINKSDEETQRHIFTWISRVASNLDAVRWAYQQESIDARLKRRIKQMLSKGSQKKSGKEEVAWKHLFKSWQNTESYVENEMNCLEARVMKSKWCSKKTKRYQEILEPFLERKPLLPSQVLELRSYKGNKMKDISAFNIISPSCQLKNPIPSKWIYKILRKDRYNLDLAIELEKSYGSPKISRRMPSITEPNLNDFEIDYGVYVAAVRYYNRFKELIRCDSSKAMKEFRSWSNSDIGVYGRLRICAAGESDFISSEEAADIFVYAPSALFWKKPHRKDLLNSLKSRWNSLPPEKVKIIETKIMSGKGHRDYNGKTIDTKISPIILQWLKDNNCKIGLDSERMISESNDYNQSIERIDYSDSDLFTCPNSIFTKSHIDHEIFLGCRVDQILEISKEYSTKRIISYTEKHPFEDLCDNRPNLALEALVCEAVKSNMHPNIEWSIWLKRKEVNAWSPHSVCLTTAALLNASDDWLEHEMLEVCSWFERVSGNYNCENTDARNLLFSRLIGILKRWPKSNASSYIRRSDHIEWLREATYSPSGCLARGLTKYHEVRNLNESDERVSYWLKNVLDLLSLDEDGGRYALASLASELELLANRFPEWTKNNIVCKDDKSDPRTRDSYWSGVADAKFQNLDYESFRLVASSAVDYVIEMGSADVRHDEKLIRLIVLGWLKKYQGRRIVSNKDLCYILTTDHPRVRAIVLGALRDYMSQNGLHDIEQEFVDFFSYVWPRTCDAKTHESTKYMLEVIFSSENIFSRVSRIVFPILGNLDNDNIDLGRLGESGNGILQDNADFVLDILSKSLDGVLHNNDSKINGVLDLIEELHPSLAEDSRMKSIRSGHSS